MQPCMVLFFKFCARVIIVNRFLSSQLILFLISGGLAAIVNFASRIIFNQWLSFSISIVISYIIGMIIAFILFRLFVFNNRKRPVGRSVLLFAVVNIFAVTQTWIVSMSMAMYALPAMGVQLWVPEIAHAVGVVVPVFTSYFGHKHFSFR